MKNGFRSRCMTLGNLVYVDLGSWWMETWDAEEPFEETGNLHKLLVLPSLRINQSALFVMAIELVEMGIEITITVDWSQSALETIVAQNGYQARLGPDGSYADPVTELEYESLYPALLSASSTRRDEGGWR